MKQLVVIQNNQIVVSSKDIADHFGKQHKDVLENIHNILAAVQIYVILQAFHP